MGRAAAVWVGTLAIAQVPKQIRLPFVTPLAVAGVAAATTTASMPVFMGIRIPPFLVVPNHNIV